MTPERLSELHALCFPHAPLTPDQARTILALPATRLFTAQDAFLLASVVPPEADITSIGVHPGARRSGQARHLIQTLQEAVDTIYLEVAETNLGAIALYERTGFTITGRRPHYYRSNLEKVDGLLMTWSSAAEALDIIQESVDPPQR